MPVAFIGHGSPMNAIEDNTYHWQWRLLGERLPRPRAILCVSAHWQAQGARVTGASHPSTIHDFFGFPQALFDVQYPAPGDAKLARRVVELLGGHKLAHVDATRGLDHGAWSVLRAMYPAADVPVVQLSIDTTMPGGHHYELAKQLAPLRDEGVLVLGSGNIVHNLALFDWRNQRPLDWAIRFDGAVKRRIGAREHIELADWPRMGADAHLAIPTPEHYLPLLYVLALQRDGDRARFFNEEVLGSLSMTSVVISAGNAVAASTPPARA
ncbi:MAG: 4,5-DOPA dioxygenase extradiol [Proteobacteria bacterium]|nr:4,5-DOPA dioxygenase extradiol [Pseudomonadota bacterium]